MNLTKITHKQKKHFYPFIGFFLLTLAIFHRVLFFGETFYLGDILTQFYPVRFFIQKWLSLGVFPNWCPQIFNGFPLLASSNTGIFNPLERIIFASFPPLYAYNLNIAVHVFFGAVFTYALVKHLCKDEETAFLSAICFAFSGFFFIYLTYITLFSICYLPLAILLAYKCFTKVKLIYAGELALVLGVQLFAGGAQYTFYTLIAIFILAIFITVKHQAGAGKRWLPLSLFALAVVGFLLFAAVQILPSLELVYNSIRKSGVDREIWEKASFPLRHFVTILIPHYWGEMFRFGIYEGDWNYIDLNCYLGIVPLLLACIPLFIRKRPAISNFFYLLICLAFLFALGKFNPLYQYLYHLPVFKSFRYPGRILVLAILGLAVNAGFGYQALVNKTEPRRLKIALVVLTIFWLALCAAIFFHLRQSSELYTIRLNGWKRMNLFFVLGLIPLYWQVFFKMNRKLFFSWLLAIILIDNFLFGYPFNPTIPTETVTKQPAVWQKLESVNDKFRIFAPKALPFYAFQRAVVVNNNRLAELVRTNLELLQGNTVLLTNLSAYDGYDQLELFQHYLVSDKLGLTKFVGKKKSSLFLARSSVKYSLNWRNMAQRDQKTIAIGEHALVFQLPGVIPRAYFARGYQVITDTSFALNYLNNSMFNPTKQVILTEKPTLSQAREDSGPAIRKANVQIVEENPTEVILEVKTPQNGFVVLNDSNYPGWEATVDGNQVEIYQANLLFRAVPVPKGKHQVIFKYRPKSWLYGAVISLLTFFALTTLIIFIQAH